MRTLSVSLQGVSVGPHGVREGLPERVGACISRGGRYYGGALPETMHASLSTAGGVAAGSCALAAGSCALCEAEAAGGRGCGSAPARAAAHAVPEGAGRGGAVSAPSPRGAPLAACHSPGGGGSRGQAERSSAIAEGW